MVNISFNWIFFINFSYSTNQGIVYFSMLIRLFNIIFISEVLCLAIFFAMCLVERQMIMMKKQKNILDENEIHFDNDD